MINEHALTSKENICVEELNYLVKKANRLGKKGREILRVFSQQDEEGTHIYFEVENLKPKHHQNGDRK